MNLSQLVTTLTNETTGDSLRLFSPEIILCVTIVALLLTRLCNWDKWLPGYWTALAGTLAAFVLSFAQFLSYSQGEVGDTELFTGLLVLDKFAVFFRLFLLLFLVLTIALTVLSGIPDREDAPDFYSLLLGSTIGMMLMASANHLLMLFLAVEMTSVPSYVMVGFLKGRKVSSEAAFKYVVYGAGAAGVMLYGISLLAGLLGTAHLPELAGRLQLLVGENQSLGSPEMRTVALGVLMVVAGLAFKLSLVPFHFWCPDAFEGAPAEVAGFLSVASKAGAFALLVRFCLAFIPLNSTNPGDITLYLGIGLGVIAAVSATFGNLAAYSQTNMKRLLAYSTIAHAGYMLMAVAAMLVARHGAPEHAAFVSQDEAVRGLGALLYYLAVYLFMNLGAFAIVALIRNEIYSEEIADYKGLAAQTPVLCVCMLICMFSLVGLPPLGGFFGKWYVFSSLFQAGKAHWFMWVVLGIGGLNTVFSLFYYLNVLKAMFMEERPADARKVDVLPLSSPGFYVIMVTLPILALGMMGPLMNGLTERAKDIAAGLLP